MSTTNGIEKAKERPVARDFLLRGGDKLADTPNFKIVGRKNEIEEISEILMRSRANNLILTGPAGVGLTALILALQALKDDISMPFDIVSKRFYWLETTALFSSADRATIEANFDRMLETLKQPVDTVLIIEDTSDFLRQLTAHGCNSLLPKLMQAIKSKRFQAIFETRDTNLSEVFGTNNDIQEHFTTLEIKEPKKGELYEIVSTAKVALEAAHEIPVSDEAIQTAIELTEKYRVPQINRAQPDRTLVLLDRALASYKGNSHKNPRHIQALNDTLADINKSIENGSPVQAFAGKTLAELEALKIEVSAKLTEENAAWEKKRKSITSKFRELREAEEAVLAEEDKIQTLKAKEAESKATDDKTTDKPQLGSFTNAVNGGGFESQAIKERRAEIAELNKIIRKLKQEYGALTADLNTGLILTAEHVRETFSRISGIPAKALGQNEAEKLLKLEDVLSERVVGQPAPVKGLVDAIKRGRAGFKPPQKPVGSFIFMGPSGVGKTELAKALAASLLDDEKSITRLDMSEYMEAHAVAKLIGAPPGYVGYEEGGQLTNAVLKRPKCVLLIDEFEKAHPKTFDVFLQMLDDGRLTDTQGRTANFSEAIIIFTTNIGAHFFLDPNMPFAEAEHFAKEQLLQPRPDPLDPKNMLPGLRPEFLNRFTGIHGFKRLELPQVEQIVRKQIKGLNDMARDGGVQIVIDPATLSAICAEYYIPREGARGPQRVIENTVVSQAAEQKIRHMDERGNIVVEYDPAEKKITTEFQKGVLASDTKPAVSGGAIIMPASAASRAVFRPMFA